jgi:cysteine synthase A
MPTTAQENLPLLRALTGSLPNPGSDDKESSKRELIFDYIANTIQRSAPTPIVNVAVAVNGHARTILLKLDGCSQWGSMKGRTALALVASVAGKVSSRTTIVESTSGNLGVALAWICRDLGIPFTAVVDSRLPPAMLGRLTRYGACIDEVGRADDSLHLLRRIERVREILRSDVNAVWTNQYENPANVDVHRLWTGPELNRQIGPELQIVFAPVSTGGSFVGLRRHLSAERLDVACVAVDVVGSAIFGGPTGHRLLTGIGASRPSTFIGQSSQPPHVMVSDPDAIAACRTLASDAGIAVGGSSGATIAGCLKFLNGRPDIKVALCLCPDMGDNYRQTLYDDEWLANNGATGALGRLVVGGQPICFARISS